MDAATDVRIAGRKEGEVMLMMMTMMMTMMTMNDDGEDCSDGVELELQSVMDASKRVTVSVPPDATLGDAAEKSSLILWDSFEVYNRVGNVVTDQRSSDHGDDTLWVGPPAVCGGATEIEIELDPEDDVVPRHEPMTKSVTFVSAYDPAVRHEVVPQPGQSVRDAAQMAGLAPRDGSGWTVYDAVGMEFDQRASEDLIGDVLYVGRRAVAAGCGSNDLGPKGPWTNRLTNRLMSLENFPSPRNLFDSIRNIDFARRR